MELVKPLPPKLKTVEDTNYPDPPGYVTTVNLNTTEMYPTTPPLVPNVPPPKKITVPLTYYLSLP